MKQMYEKILSISFGGIIGFFSGILTDRFVEVILMSLLGGIAGWYGGKIAKWIDVKCANILKKTKNDNKTN